MLVEQHIELALTIADRGYVLSHGEIVAPAARRSSCATNHELLISSYFGEHADLFAGRTVTASPRHRPIATPTPRDPIRATRSSARRSCAARSRRTPALSSRTSLTSFDDVRAAVRNALIRLEQEGLVVREPHRGARVRQVTDSEAIEILQARAVLEGLAVRLTAERIDEAGAERLRESLARHRELLESGDLLGASDANADLHATLLQLSGHSTAQRLIHGLNSQTVRYQYRTILIAGRPAASQAEHAAIVEAVIAHEPEKAEDAMRRHLFNVADALQRGALTRIDSVSRGVIEAGGG